MTSAVYGTDMVGHEALCSGHLTVTVTTDLRALPGINTFCEQAEDFHKTLQYQYYFMPIKRGVHSMLLTKFTLCGSDCKNKIKLTTDSSGELITMDLMLIPMT